MNGSMGSSDAQAKISMEEHCVPFQRSVVAKSDPTAANIVLSAQLDMSASGVFISSSSKAKCLPLVVDGDALNLPQERDQDPCPLTTDMISIFEEIPAVVPVDKDLGIDQAQMPDTIESNPGLNIKDLPLNILHILFEGLEDCSATCLALTCKPFYSTFKSMNPGPISIWKYTTYTVWSPYQRNILLGEKKIWLGELLEGWVGPRYRRLRQNYRCESCTAPYYPFFLSRNVYGNYTGPYDKSVDKEKKLKARYEDWAKAIYRNDDKTWHHILPYPYNKGEAWYDEAKVIILGDAEIHKNWRAWMRYWNQSEAFKFVSYMDKLKVAQRLEEKHESLQQNGAVALKMGKLKRWGRRHFLNLRYRWDSIERDYSGH